MKHLQAEDVWITKKIYDDAETAYYENISKVSLTPLAGEVAKARQKLIESRDTFTSTVPSNDDAIRNLERKVMELEKSVNYILKKLNAASI